MNRIRIALTLMVFSAAAVSCSREDPSAAKERERQMAELLMENGQMKAKIEAVESELSRARDQLEEFKNQAAALENAQMPSEEEIEAKFTTQMRDWKEKIEGKNPAFRVVTTITDEPQGPTGEYPFKCSGTFVMSGPTGDPKEVHWKAKGTPTGEWVFDESSEAVGRVALQSTSSGQAQANSGNSRPTEKPAPAVEAPAKDPIQIKIDEARKKGLRVIDTRDPSKAVMGGGRGR
jgi:hypothetical protein